MNGRPALFLDRDGVVCRAIVRNGRPFSAQSVEQLEILPGVEQTMRKAGNLGMMCIVVTNQPEVARGTLARDVVEAMHAKLRFELPIADVLACYHDDADRCQCRKPKPGLLLEAAERHEIDLGESYIVGDRWRDVEAGRAAGCWTVWIPSGYDEPEPMTHHIVAEDLYEAIDRIAANMQRVSRSRARWRADAANMQRKRT